MSVENSIGSAVQNAINALSLTSATVILRKTQSLPQGKDPIQIVIAIGDRTVIDPLTSTKDNVTYPVAVAIIRQTGRTLQDDETAQTWMGQIRSAVNKPSCFSSVSQFDQVDVLRESPYNPTGLSNDIVLSVEVFAVRTIEARAR